MITLRCTKKLLKHLGIVPDEALEPATGSLGDWYANLIPTVAGELIIFVNERSLLTVAIPEWEAEDLVGLFRMRVANLLRMIAVSAELVERELTHLEPVRFGRTASRRVLGSMNDIAWHYQCLAERGVGRGPLSLSNAEVTLSDMPCSPIGYERPADVAKRLLQQGFEAA